SKPSGVQISVTSMHRSSVQRQMMLSRAGLMTGGVVFIGIEALRRADIGDLDAPIECPEAGLARSNIWPRRLLKIRSPKMRNLISQ
ncbi:unnamed protein product, partial [Ascophyllum nodosum]